MGPLINKQWHNDCSAGYWWSPGLKTHFSNPSPWLKTRFSRQFRTGNDFVLYLFCPKWHQLASSQTRTHSFSFASGVGALFFKKGRCVADSLSLMEVDCLWSLLITPCHIVLFITLDEDLPPKAVVIPASLQQLVFSRRDSSHLSSHPMTLERRHVLLVGDTSVPQLRISLN